MQACFNHTIIFIIHTNIMFLDIIHCHVMYLKHHRLGTTEYVLPEDGDKSSLRNAVVLNKHRTDFG
jgi:hypothetical protein